MQRKGVITYILHVKSMVCFRFRFSHPTSPYKPDPFPSMLYFCFFLGFYYVFLVCLNYYLQSFKFFRILFNSFSPSPLTTAYTIDRFAMALYRSVGVWLCVMRYVNQERRLFAYVCCNIILRLMHKTG